MISATAAITSPIFSSSEEIPAELVDAIRRAVSVDPAERFESADELASQLGLVPGQTSGFLSGWIDEAGAVRVADPTDVAALTRYADALARVASGDPVEQLARGLILLKGKRSDQAPSVRALVDHVGGGEGEEIATSRSFSRDAPPRATRGSGRHVPRVLQPPVARALERVVTAGTLQIWRVGETSASGLGRLTARLAIPRSCPSRPGLAAARSRVARSPGTVQSSPAVRLN